MTSNKENETKVSVAKQNGDHQSHDHHGHDHDHDHRHGHNQGHHHGHSHGHDHGHHRRDEATSALVWAFFLNAGFCIIEGIGGHYAGSQAVVADALHDFGDSLSLLLLITFRWMASKPAKESYSYGYRRLNLIGAAFVGGSLIFGSLVIIGSSFGRLTEPHSVNAPLMLILAVFGVLVNALAFYRLRSQSGVGERMVSLHLLEDLWGWVIIFFGAVAIQIYSWYWLDPLLSIVLAFYILWQSLSQVKSLGRLLLLGASTEFSVADVVQRLSGITDVQGIHHVHVWELEGGFHVVTAHLVVREGSDVVSIKQQARAQLQLLGRCEVTLEVENPGEKCLDPEHSHSLH